MRRELPPGLSENERTVLSEFFAGRVSAGQLSERLSLGQREARLYAVAGHPERDTAVPSTLSRRRANAKRPWLIALVTIAFAGGGIGAALAVDAAGEGSQLRGAVQDGASDHGGIVVARSHHRKVDVDQPRASSPQDSRSGAG